MNAMPSRCRGEQFRLAIGH